MSVICDAKEFCDDLLNKLPEIENDQESLKWLVNISRVYNERMKSRVNIHRYSDITEGMMKILLDGKMNVENKYKELCKFLFQKTTGRELILQEPSREETFNSKLLDFMIDHINDEVEILRRIYQLQEEYGLSDSDTVYEYLVTLTDFDNDNPFHELCKQQCMNLLKAWDTEALFQGCERFFSEHYEKVDKFDAYFFLQLKRFAVTMDDLIVWCNAETEDDNIKKTKAKIKRVINNLLQREEKGREA